MSSTKLGPITLYNTADVRVIADQYLNLTDEDKPHMFAHYMKALSLSDKLSDTRTAVRSINGYLEGVAHLPDVSKIQFWYFLAICFYRQDELDLCKKHLNMCLEAMPKYQDAKMFKSYVNSSTQPLSKSTNLMSGVAGLLAGALMFGNSEKVPTWLLGMALATPAFGKAKKASDFVESALVEISAYGVVVTALIGVSVAISGISLENKCDPERRRFWAEITIDNGFPVSDRRRKLIAERYI